GPVDVAVDDHEVAAVRAGPRVEAPDVGGLVRPRRHHALGREVAARRAGAVHAEQGGRRRVAVAGPGARVVDRAARPGAGVLGARRGGAGDDGRGQDGGGDEDATGEPSGQGVHSSSRISIWSTFQAPSAARTVTWRLYEAEPELFSSP